jgi:hypothetical protein
VKHRTGYKGYVIEALASELRDDGFSVELYIEEHDSSRGTVTQFHVLQAGRQKIDQGFEPRSAVASR